MCWYIMNGCSGYMNLIHKNVDTVGQLEFEKYLVLTVVDGLISL